MTLPISRRLILRRLAVGATCGLAALVASRAGVPVGQASAQIWTGGAAASESAWDEGHASRARLIAGARDGDAVLAGIEIELAEGYKTYWRHAGDSGLPPEIDWAQSRNVADIALDFPAPGRFKDTSGTFFGYEDAVILPLTITPIDPAEPASLAISLSYGVCKDVCIPAFADFALTIPAAQSSRHAPRIARAFTQVPRPVAPGERHAGLAFHDHAVTEDGRLAITVEAPADALLLAEGPDFHWFLDPADAGLPHEENGRLTFPVTFAETPRTFEGEAAFRFTLVYGDAGIETSFTLDEDTIRRLTTR